MNKLLVPEWPCIIEVSYIYSSYICTIQLEILELFGDGREGGRRCYSSQYHASFYSNPTVMYFQIFNDDVTAFSPLSDVSFMFRTYLKYVLSKASKCFVLLPTFRLASCFNGLRLHLSQLHVLRFQSIRLL
jgi:hypothetical protein